MTINLNVSDTNIVQSITIFNGVTKRFTTVVFNAERRSDIINYLRKEGIENINEMREMYPHLRNQSFSYTYAVNKEHFICNL